MEDCKYEDYLTIGEVTKQPGTVKVGGNEHYARDGYIINYWDTEKKRYKVFTKSKFVKLFTGEGKDIADLIDSDADLGRMHRLIKSIDDSNMIIYSNNSKKAMVPADKDLIRKLIGLSKDRSQRFLAEMIKLDIIKVDEVDGCKRYFVNPIYAMADKAITLRLFKLFRESLVGVLTKQAVEDLDRLIYYDQNPSKLIELREKYDQEQKIACEEEMDRMGAMFTTEC